jgi:hypothetical protein
MHAETERSGVRHADNPSSRSQPEHGPVLRRQPTARPAGRLERGSGTGADGATGTGQDGSAGRADAGANGCGRGWQPRRGKEVPLREVPRPSWGLFLRRILGTTDGVLHLPGGFLGSPFGLIITYPWALTPTIEVCDKPLAQARQQAFGGFQVRGIKTFLELTEHCL